jgi:phytoene dehydrogenase-like protein
VPGGRNGLLELGGYRFDTGPTVLTMPGLIADALACVGEELDDWLDLRPVVPAHRSFFPDGSVLDVPTESTSWPTRWPASAVRPDQRSARGRTGDRSGPGVRLPRLALTGAARAHRSRPCPTVGPAVTLYR